MQYYDEISKGYNELHREEQLKKLNIIKEILKLNGNEKLLDIGCGTGVNSDFDCKVIGIDSSIELLKLNKNKNKINGIGESLPFRDNSFDIIISITAIHNFDDIKKGINEMKRVGKDKFIFSILKKSDKYELIKNLIYANFLIFKKIEEEKDVIFFTSKKNIYH